LRRANQRGKFGHDSIALNQDFQRQWRDTARDGPGIHKEVCGAVAAAADRCLVRPRTRRPIAIAVGGALRLRGTARAVSGAPRGTEGSGNRGQGAKPGPVVAAGMRVALSWCSSRERTTGGKILGSRNCSYVPLIKKPIKRGMWPLVSKKNNPQQNQLGIAGNDRGSPKPQSHCSRPGER